MSRSPGTDMGGTLAGIGFSNETKRTHMHQVRSGVDADARTRIDGQRSIAFEVAGAAVTATARRAHRARSR